MESSSIGLAASLGNDGDLELLLSQAEAEALRDALVNAIDPPRRTGPLAAWSEVRDRPDFLGRFVPRDEALQWPQLDRLWHICDHLTDDRRFAAVAAWLCGYLDTALDADDASPNAG